ncbi:MAG: aspartate/glutamate racemase family protein [Burkholderiaceae bacterium]
MTKHIGIVGCSAEGAALCYRTICMEGAQILGPHAHPEVSMHTPSLSEYVKCLEQHDMRGVGELMLRSAHKLASAGAQFLICPDNTIHQAFDYVAARSPLPWLHIAQVAAEEAKRRGFKKIGITGTLWLTESEVYPEQLARAGLEFQRPAAADRQALGRIIMDELVYGVLNASSIMSIQRVIEQFKRDGCDAVVLGCTELPLAISDANSALPTLDSTRLLARAALAYATQAQAR